MSCDELLRRLVEMLRHRVRTGHLTERRMAKLAGISQPHLHNVLKGIRRLSPGFADKLMKSLGLSIADILWWHPTEVDPGSDSVPILRDRIGPGSQVDWNAFRGHLALPRSITRKLASPVGARLAPDSGLPAHLRANDLVIVERAIPPVAGLAPGQCWVVAAPGGMRVRYLRHGKGGVEMISDPDGAGPEALTLAVQYPGDLIRGRIVWTSRELETPASGSSGAVGGGD